MRKLVAFLQLCARLQSRFMTAVRGRPLGLPIFSTAGSPTYVQLSPIRLATFE